MQRTYGRFQVEPTCPHCGSHRLHVEERDATVDEHGNAPSPESYGRWIVCDECCREWLNEAGS